MEIDPHKFCLRKGNWLESDIFSSWVSIVLLTNNKLTNKIAWFFLLAKEVTTGHLILGHCMYVLKELYLIALWS